MKKKLTVLLTLVLFSILILGACSPGASPSGIPIRTSAASSSAEELAGPPAPVAGATNNIVLTIENFGEIHAELYPDIAPITVANFQKLISENFFDGLSFHRSVPGFMIQGGDPNGDGSGGPGYTIKGEFSSNKVENPLKHVEGILSMARRGDSYDSAGSQFFIMLGAAPHLDGDYAAFGKVTSGMDVAQKIAEQATIGEALNPPIKIVSVKFE